MIKIFTLRLACHALPWSLLRDGSWSRSPGLRVLLVLITESCQLWEPFFSSCCLRTFQKLLCLSGSHSCDKQMHKNIWRSEILFEKEKRRGRKEERGKKEEKVRRKREYKTALKNRPQRLFLSMRSYFMPTHDVSGTWFKSPLLAQAVGGTPWACGPLGEDIWNYSRNSPWNHTCYLSRSDARASTFYFSNNSK